LRSIFRENFEVVRGSVSEQARGIDVVACPVLRNAINGGMGAQGAVRRAAGREMEVAVARLLEIGPLPEESVTLVPGGLLAQRVALCVTEPPRSLRQMSSSQDVLVVNLINFIGRLHGNLLRETREAGFRSVAMPTLCTGGMGIPPSIVATAAVLAVQRDFLASPADPLHVRVACFEAEHLPTFNMIKDEVLQCFFEPEKVEAHLVDALLSPDADFADS